MYVSLSAPIKALLFYTKFREEMKNEYGNRDLRKQGI